MAPTVFVYMGFALFAAALVSLPALADTDLEVRWRGAWSVERWFTKRSSDVLRARFVHLLKIGAAQ